MADEHVEVMVVRRSVPLRSMVDLARAEGWNLLIDSPRMHTSVSTLEWDVGTGRVGWYEEHEFGVRRIKIHGADEVRPLVRARIECEDRADLVALASGGATPQSLDALRALALLEARHPSAELLDLLRRWLGSPNVNVRRALLHVLRIGFYELIDDVERLAREDAPLAVRWSKLHEAMRRRMQPARPL